MILETLTLQDIHSARSELSRLLNGEQAGIAVTAGPCAQYDSDIINNNADQLARERLPGLLLLSRHCLWKPRSSVAEGMEKPWAGWETTDPDDALRSIVDARSRGVQIAMEVGKVEHINRYCSQDLLTFAWLGARSLADDVLFETVAGGPSLLSVPLGVKNDINGNLESALARINVLNKRRQELTDRPAPAVLVFRGGSNFQNPTQWENQYKRAFEASEGKLAVDVAHGGEMAFDQAGHFQKTCEGQIACMNRVIELAGAGMMPKLVLIEASDFIQPNPRLRVDPPMPFATAIDGAQRLHKIAMRSLTTN